MRTTYILDTSVLITDPYAYKHFNHSDVIIPIAVLNELDKLKKQSNEVGKNARISIKVLDDISSQGNVSSGVILDNDILIKIDTTYFYMNGPEYAGLGDSTYGDTQILACAIYNFNNHSSKDVILVSNDINLRVKAKSRSLQAIAHEESVNSLNELYSGTTSIKNEELGIELQRRGSVNPIENNIELLSNECVYFENHDGNILSMGRKVDNDKIKLIKKHNPWGISSKNKEQAFAMDLVMDQNVDLVTLIGKAGTGKSLIVLACALELVLAKKQYDKLIIYRPIQAVSNDIGFLPGTLDEKLAPWFQAILDNFEILFSSKGNGDWRKTLDIYQKKGQIEMEAITYIRGRSIPNSIILVDEAQNLTKQDIKTILTRAGENTKIILTGDIEQIDNLELDAINNGLTHVIEKFKYTNLAGHITLIKGERSRLASKAAEILQ